jgi:hypothetical protein
MCSNNLKGEAIFCFCGRFVKSQTWFNKSRLHGLLSEFQIHRLRSDAQCGRESFAVNSKERFVYDCGFYTRCSTRKVHAPETPIGNKDNLFADGIRKREEVAEIIFWLDGQTCFAESALQESVCLFEDDCPSALGALMVNLHDSR